MSALNGWKTYIVVAATVIWAALSMWKGSMDTQTGIGIILGAGGLGALRHGVATK